MLSQCLCRSLSDVLPVIFIYCFYLLLFIRWLLRMVGPLPPSDFSPERLALLYLSSINCEPPLLSHAQTATVYPFRTLCLTTPASAKRFFCMYETTGFLFSESVGDRRLLYSLTSACSSLYLTIRISGVLLAVLLPHFQYMTFRNLLSSLPRVLPAFLVCRSSRTSEPLIP